MVITSWEKGRICDGEGVNGGFQGGLALLIFVFFFLTWCLLTECGHYNYSWKYTDI